MRQSVFRTGLLAAVLLPAAVSANPIGPVYPPPGGVTFAGSGPGIGQTGGRTNTYTNFDPVTGDYSDLWWGPTDSDINPLSIYAPLFSGTSSGTSTTQALTFNNFLDANTAIWTAANPWTITLFGGGTISAPVRYRLDTFDMFGNDAALILASSVTGLTGSAGVVLAVQGTLLTNGFRAQQIFEVFVGGSWIGVDTYYNGLSTGCNGCVIKSVNGGFWSEANVPEPTSLALLGFSFLFSARTIRKRARAARAC
jgi:hypothetical protein